jgi:opacity protein-like surface antigen
MKFKLALIAMIAGAAFSAQAQDANKSEAFKSTAVRAEVKAEAKAANKAGEIKEGEIGQAAPKAKSTKMRADVKAEAKAANKAGEIKNGEMAK